MALIHNNQVFTLNCISKSRILSTGNRNTYMNVTIVPRWLMLSNLAPSKGNVIIRMRKLQLFSVVSDWLWIWREKRWMSSMITLPISVTYLKIVKLCLLGWKSLILAYFTPRLSYLSNCSENINVWSVKTEFLIYPWPLAGVVFHTDSQFWGK